MPVPAGGKEIHKNNDLNGALGLLDFQCVFCRAAKSNRKDCGVGQQESKINVWQTGLCLHVVL